MIGTFFNRNAQQSDPSAQAQFDEAAFLHDMFSLQADQITCSDIPQGQASISLVKFASADGPFMIRKRVANKYKNEIAFMHGLIRPYALTKNALQIDWPLPQVFDVVQSEAHTDIYMQYVDGVSYPSAQVATDLIRPLVKAAYALSLVLPVICRNADLTLQHRGQPGGKFFAVAENMVPGSAARLRDVVRLQRELPLLVSHNDIFWPNMGTVPQGDSAQVTFIDFGMLGLNAVGAELHHFARISIGSKSRTMFFRRICRHYAHLTRIDPAVIEMNAMLYAMMRLAAYDLVSNQERIAGLCAGVLERYEALTAG